MLKCLGARSSSVLIAMRLSQKSASDDGVVAVVQVKLLAITLDESSLYPTTFNVLLMSLFTL